jgi:hypothetical protein
MTTQQTPTQPRPLPSTQTSGLSGGAATTNKPGGTQLSDDALECVTGGRLGPGPMPLNPQPLPRG